MNNDQIEETLRSLLEEVPSEQLVAYFEKKKIELKNYPNRDDLVKLLLTSEYRKDVRAAILLELNAASQKFESDLKESAEKLEKLTNETNAKIAAMDSGLEKSEEKIEKLTNETNVKIAAMDSGLEKSEEKLEKLTNETNAKIAAMDGWKNLFSLTGVLFALITLFVTIFGGVKLLQLNSDADNAKTKLVAGAKIIEGYQHFMLSTVSASVAATLNSASTRWFSDAETPVADQIAAGRDNLERLSLLPRESSDENARLETNLILKFVTQLESIANSPPENTDAREFSDAENRWQALGEEWEKAQLSKTVTKERADTYRAYIENVLGIFSHTRYKALDRKKSPVEARQYLAQAREHFTKSMELRKTYSPAASNLGVALLDVIELKIKLPQPGEAPATESDFSETYKLLMKARDTQQQPAKTQARVQNNLAMCFLLRAVQAAAATENYLVALEYLAKADEHLDRAISILSTPAVVFASKAEVAAFRAVLKGRRQENAEADIQKVDQWIERAVSANYGFEKSLKKVLDDSPAFLEFHNLFQNNSDKIWERVDFQKS